MFFIHKYLTQSTITATDALLRAGDDIYNVLANIYPTTNKTRQAINFLMDIFKEQANKNESVIDSQRVCKEAAQAQRVVEDEVEKMIGIPLEEMMIDNENLRTTKELKVYYPSNDAKTNNGVPAIIRKDESDDLAVHGPRVYPS